MISKRLVTSLTMVALTAAGCVGDTTATTTGPPVSTSQPAEEATTTQSEGGPNQHEFALGIEYTELGLASPFGEAGLRWAKTRLEAFAWGQVEPDPPVGGAHDYDWACTDGLIGEYQQAGMVNLQSYISTVSEWGNDPDRPPEPADEHRDDYLAWIRAMVERYDGDGVDDMPGLMAPVDHWVVGGEWTGFWATDDGAGYVEVLADTVSAIRSANETAQVGAIPFLLYDVFGGYPARAEIEQRLAGPEPTYRNSMKGIHQILDAHDLVDYFTFHALGDYSEIPLTTSWIRGELNQRGSDDPIWIDDAFPLGLVVNRPLGTRGWPTFAPVTGENEEGIYQLLVAASRDHDTDALAWFEAEIAKAVVHKAVVSAASGAVGINIGNTEDWMHDTLGGLRHLQANLVGAAAISGLIDVSHPQGYEACVPRQPGSSRPALANLSLLADLLGPGLENVARLPGDPDTHLYEITRVDGVSWVVWAEDRVYQLPGEPEDPVAVTLDIPGSVGSLQLRVAATSDEGMGVGEVEVVDGAIEIMVASTPIFVIAP